jgi:hypothetical protein
MEKETRRRKQMNALSNANVGEVYNFDYVQPLHGHTKRMLARVVAVKKLSRERILQLHAQSNYRRYDTSSKEPRRS